MTTIELEKFLDIHNLQIDTSLFNDEELKVIQRLGRVVRNIELLEFLLNMHR